jgi:hypothetical protein
MSRESNSYTEKEIVAVFAEVFLAVLGMVVAAVIIGEGRFSPGSLTPWQTVALIFSLLSAITAITLLVRKLQIPLSFLGRPRYSSGQTRKSDFDTVSYIVAAIEGQNSDATKVRTIRSIVSDLQTDLSGEGVGYIVSHFVSDHRILDALEELYPVIQKPISNEAMRRIQSNISSDSCKSSAVSIFTTGRR